MTKKKEIFKITFVSNGKIYEVFAKQVCQSSLFGFIEVGDYVFSKTTSVVIDPSEERLKKEFEGIKRSYLPVQSIIRIDEVEKKGTGKISDLPKDGNVISPFPAGGLIPLRNEKDSTDK